ncbi:MAG: hypothetical protein IJE97_04445 [Thermoguttaceae bacterium]|nr:hypothetical protein [Thermoguttaceae bacterium]MBQ6829459.1 hypothetical protein [Thermoguttaceae bacterium]MBQ7029417.1 hypothetical protein [Thermoguttaceae bacterium]MBQ7110475.1 hypothetical protein [Thermoguttaceae bacterium]
MPIVCKLSGSVTLKSEKQRSNALSPIATTGLPSISLGTSNARRVLLEEFRYRNAVDFVDVPLENVGPIFVVAV